MAFTVNLFFKEIVLLWLRLNATPIVFYFNLHLVSRMSAPIVYRGLFRLSFKRISFQDLCAVLPGPLNRCGLVVHDPRSGCCWIHRCSPVAKSAHAL